MTVVIGAAFLLSGVVNVLLLGSWGRFTGRLPTDNPYRRDRHPDEGAPRAEQPADGQAGDAGADRLPATYDGAADAIAVRELADAERAAARHAATADQRRGVRAAGRVRRDEDRLARWRRRSDPAPGDTGDAAPDPGNDDDGR